MKQKLIDKLVPPLLPLLSGSVLGLIFYYPKTWFLVFISLVPFIIFMERFGKDIKTAFIGVTLMIIFMNILLLIALWPSSEFIRFLNENILYQSPRWLRTTTVMNTIFSIMVFVFSIYFAIPFILILGSGYYILRIISKNQPSFDQTIIGILTIPSLWIISEFSRSLIASGLTFGHIGYRVVDFLPLAITARIWGVYGLGFFVVLINQLFAKIVCKEFKNKIVITIMGIFVIMIMIAGFLQSKDETKKGWQGYELTVGVVHGVVDLPQYKEIFKNFKLEQELILFPNTVGETIFIDNKSSLKVLEIKNSLKEIINLKENQLIIAGHDLVEKGDRYNALIAWNEGGVQGVYKKRILFPFGEHFPVLENLFPQIFLSIKKYTPSLEKNGIIFVNFVKPGMTICQEIYIPSLIRQDIKEGANLLINSGSEWQFGKVVHEESLRVARLRAIESSRFLIRSMKQGISTVINPLGQIIAMSDINKKPAFIEAKVKLIDGSTVYARYGDVIIFGILLIFIIFIILKGESKNSI
jgi:apolipoprotein N-acyltransferase